MITISCTARVHGCVYVHASYNGQCKTILINLQIGPTNLGVTDILGILRQLRLIKGISQNGSDSTFRKRGVSENEIWFALQKKARLVH